MKNRGASAVSSTTYTYSSSSETYCSYKAAPKEVIQRKLYHRIKFGLKKANPAAIVLWAFHKLPSSNGLTSRRVINFIKKHYKTVDDPRKTGKSIGAMLRCAVDFGLLMKHGKKFYPVKFR